MKVSGARAPTRIALDTSAYSRFRAANAAVLDLLAAARIVYLPTVVLGELEAGFQLGRRTRENQSTLAEFLQESFVEILPVTADVARRYGGLFAQLRRAGTPIPVNDIWIAACAIEVGAHLVSFDGDFERIENLDCTVLKGSVPSCTDRAAGAI